MDADKEFVVNFHNMSKDYFCVLDIYPIDSPEHPHRHPGWYRFDIEKDGEYVFKLLNENGTYNLMSKDGLKVTDSWQSDSLDADMMPLSIRVVIRKKINNEIMYEDRVIVFDSEETYRRQEDMFREMERNINDLPVTNHIIPQKLKVNIVLRNFADKDAVGYYAWESYSFLCRMGIAADIYVQQCDDRFRPFVHHVQELFTDDSVDKDTIIFYNYSIKDEYLEDILKLKCRKICYFHGITNPEKIRVFDAELAEECRLGLEALYKIVDFDEIVVNSKCTANKLIEAITAHGNVMIDKTLAKEGVNRESVRLEILKELEEKYITTVLEKARGKIYVSPPVVIGDSAWQFVEADGQFRGSVDKIGDVMLYVGRMYPHKRVEDVLEIFQEVLKENKDAILLLIGGAHNSYHKYLDYKIKQLPKESQDRILFFPQVSRNQLKAAYEAAGVFITMSEDEGFCVPVLEALRFHLPVLAKKDENSATSEVLGRAGKMILNKDYTSIAKEINHIFKDNSYRNALLQRQDERRMYFSDSKLEETFLDNILRCYYA